MWELLWWLFVYVALPMGIAYLGGLLLAEDPPEVEGEIEGAQSRSWNPHTTQQEGLPRPRSYGRNLHHGNTVSCWTRVKSDKREVLHMIVELGEGPTKGISGVIYLNDQPSGDFSVNTRTRRGTMNQTVMSGFEDERLEYTQKVELIYNKPYYFTTPNNLADDIRYTYCFPNGLIYYSSDGEIGDAYGHIKVMIKELPSGGWVELYNQYIIKSTRTPLFYEHEVSDRGFNVQPGKQYKLSFERRHQAIERLTGNLQLRSIREVIDVAFTRPGKVLIGIIAIAASRLSGHVDVKAVSEDRIINTYNGTDWLLKYSRNRAWVVYDVVTQPIVTGDGSAVAYGIDRYEGIDPQYLDLDFFYAWSQFCEVQIHNGYGGYEDRCACDIIIDSFTDVFSLAHKIAEVGRAHLYWKGNVLTGWIDTTAASVDLVTMDSMMHKTWKNNWAIKDELAGVIEVFYKDSRIGFERTSAEASNEDAGGYQNVVSLEGIGVTTRGTAIHYIKHLLKRNQLIRNTNVFRIHKDGFRYSLGDVIRLQCKIANWGHAFRVVSSTADTITVDRDASDEINGSDLLHIRSYDTVTEQVVTDSYIVSSVVANVITATEDWDVTPVKNNLVAVGPVGDIKLRRIIKLRPMANNYFDVTVETYDTDLFLTDLYDPAFPDWNYVWPGPPKSLTPPMTQDDITEAIDSAAPPIINFTPILSNCKWVVEELFESHITGGNTSYTVGQTGVSNSCHQTFTPDEAHMLSKAAIELYDMQESGLTGEVTVEIFDTSGGYPVGSALCSGVLDASLIQPPHMSDVYSGVNFNTGVASGITYGTYISPDGTKLYVNAQYGAKVYQYTLTTPWDISTATYVAYGNADAHLWTIYNRGIFFKDDGTVLYIVGSSSSPMTPSIFGIPLTTAWDITTLTSTGLTQKQTFCQWTMHQSLRFNSAGTKYFLLDGGSSTNDAVFEFAIATPWDITTASTSISQSTSIAAYDTSPRGHCFTEDGKVMYVSGGVNKELYKWNLPTAWLLSGESKDSYEMDISDVVGNIRDIWCNPNGKTIIIADSGGILYEFNLPAIRGDFHEVELKNSDDEIINLLVDTMYDIRVTYDSYVVSVSEVEFVYNADGDDNYENGKLMLDAGSGPAIVDTNYDFNFKEYGYET